MTLKFQRPRIVMWVSRLLTSSMSFSYTAVYRTSIYSYSYGIISLFVVFVWGCLVWSGVDVVASGGGVQIPPPACLENRFAPCDALDVLVRLLAEKSRKNPGKI